MMETFCQVAKKFTFKQNFFRGMNNTLRVIQDARVLHYEMISFFLVSLTYFALFLSVSPGIPHKFARNPPDWIAHSHKTNRKSFSRSAQRKKENKNDDYVFFLPHFSTP